MAVRESIKNDKTTIEKSYFIWGISADSKTFCKGSKKFLGKVKLPWLLYVVFKDDAADNVKIMVLRIRIFSIKLY